MFTKIDELMWKDIKFKKLSIDSKLLFIYLLSCQHRNVLGLYNLPKYYIQGDILYPIERVSKGLDELSNNGFIRYDEGSETVLVNNFLKYNPLDNANQVKGASKVLKTIPKTHLFYDLLDNIKDSDIKRSDELSKAINKYLKANDFERVPKGLPKPMGEQEEVDVDVKEEVDVDVKEKEVPIVDIKAEQKNIEIFDYWQSKNELHTHKYLTETIKKQLNKLPLKKVDEVILAIDRYLEILKDKNYYYSYAWTLNKFLKQSNGYLEFLDDGSNWVDYSKRKGESNGQDKQNNKIKKYDTDEERAKFIGVTLEQYREEYGTRE